MMIETYKCVCPKCKKEQIYSLVISYCSFMANALPENKCECGQQLMEKDIIEGMYPKYKIAGRNLKTIFNKGK